MRDDRGEPVARRWRVEGRGWRERASDVFEPPSVWGVFALVFVCLVILWRWDGAVAWVVVGVLMVGGLVWQYFFGSGPVVSRWACRTCGYDLRGAVREADGCAVCSECGAAWRVEGEVGE